MRVRCGGVRNRVRQLPAGHPWGVAHWKGFATAENAHSVISDLSPLPTTRRTTRTPRVPQPDALDRFPNPACPQRALPLDGGILNCRWTRLGRARTTAELLLVVGYKGVISQPVRV